jgi:hypothetical protein
MPQAVVPLMVATTAVTAYGTYQAGKAQEKQAQYNAQIIERDAEIRENNLKDFDKLVNFEVRGMRREYNAYRGQNVVNYAKGNVELSGTVEEVMRANLETYIDDEYNFKYNAEKEKQQKADGAAMSRIQASAVRAKGKYARASANLNTVSTLLSGASQVGQYAMLT